MPVMACSSCGYVVDDPSQPCPLCETILAPESSHVITPSDSESSPVEETPNVASPTEAAADDSERARGAGRNYDYDVFISFKNSDKDGNRTEESFIATQLYEYLKSRGLRVFFSVRELEFLGKSRYTDVIDIDKALETSRALIAVGCSRENLEAKWVRHEWSSFLNEIRSGLKPNGEGYVVYKGMKVADLPRALRQQQAFNVDAGDAFARVCNFIQRALAHDGYVHSPQDAEDALESEFESSHPETPVIENAEPSFAPKSYEITEDGSEAVRGTDANHDYYVFISFKNSDKNGKATEDSVIATQL